VKCLDNEKLLLTILAIMFLGYIWAVPTTTIYNSIITILAAAIGVGLLANSRSRKRKR
jgi:hypothetical protein